MKFIRILFEQSSRQKLIDYLNDTFGSSADNVSVESLVEDSLIELTWSGSKEPDQLAIALTTEMPDLVLETSSSTGIDSHSRYFNGTQLW